MNREIFFGYLAAVSLLSVIVAVADKIKARRGERRVPENTLMLLAALGGSAAMLVTMLLIRHKTRHIRFMLGIPIIMILQAPVVYWLLTRVLVP
ncbi:MAG: DUF1294 domain-containing protein [Clostridia bacterium]|nr:DUF1294 domain-containing protein [Clostridia bacterium]